MKNFVIAVLSVFAFPLFAFALANPASVHCTQNGGTLQIQTDKDGGQFGECTLPSGTVCEEWAYFKGECGNNSSSVNMANPASVHCTQNGGTLQMKTDKDGGQFGECTLPSGTVCEEWAYLKGECGNNSFSDITSNIFKDDISALAKKGIISGYTDGTYKPDATINRAEFIKIIISSTYAEEKITSCDSAVYGFKDVKKDDWFAPYVCTAKAAGMVNGYADNTFQPANSITLAEAMKILFKGFEKPVADPTCYMNKCEEWYAPYLFAATNIFTDGKNPTITKMRTGGVTYEQLGVVNYKITRGEMAYFINTLSQSSQNSESPLFLLPENSGAPISVLPQDGASSNILHGLVGKYTCINALPANNSIMVESAAMIFTEKKDGMICGLLSNTIPEAVIPSNCTSWFDGCNTCTAQNGVLGGCTKMFCIRAEKPYCRQTTEETLSEDPLLKLLQEDVMVTPSYENIPATCSTWFDGCNTCGVQDGKATFCTLMACFSKDGQPTKKPYCIK